VRVAGFLLSGSCAGSDSKPFRSRPFGRRAAQLDQRLASFNDSLMGDLLSMTANLSLLIVDCDVGFVRAAAELARRQDFEATIAANLVQARRRLEERAYDAAVVACDLPDGTGLDLLDLPEFAEGLPVIAVGGAHYAEVGSPLPNRVGFVHAPKPIAPSHFSRLLGSLRQQAVSRRSTAGGASSTPLETPDSITFWVGTSLREVQKRLVAKTLTFYDNNRTRAARALGVAPRTLYNKLGSRTKPEPGPSRQSRNRSRNPPQEE
jgi:DNA-binding NtrC family response regulator